VLGACAILIDILPWERLTVCVSVCGLGVHVMTLTGYLRCEVAYSVCFLTLCFDDWYARMLVIFACYPLSGGLGDLERERESERERECVCVCTCMCSCMFFCV
jgi:hypothetical protein